MSLIHYRTSWTHKWSYGLQTFSSFVARDFARCVWELCPLVWWTGTMFLEQLDSPFISDQSFGIRLEMTLIWCRVLHPPECYSLLGLLYWRAFPRLALCERERLWALCSSILDREQRRFVSIRMLFLFTQASLPLVRNQNLYKIYMPFGIKRPLPGKMRSDPWSCRHSSSITQTSFPLALPADQCAYLGVIACGLNSWKESGLTRLGQVALLNFILSCLHHHKLSLVSLPMSWWCKHRLMTLSLWSSRFLKVMLIYNCELALRSPFGRGSILSISFRRSASTMPSLDFVRPTDAGPGTALNFWDGAKPCLGEMAMELWSVYEDSLHCLRHLLLRQLVSSCYSSMLWFSPPRK